MTIDFDHEKHEYRVDGKLVPSVTQLCRFLNYDTATEARPWLRDAAADRGTRVHAYTAALDYGEILAADEIDEDCRPYVEAYQRFLRDLQPEWLDVERIVASTFSFSSMPATGTYPFAGTVDRYGLIDGKPVVLDIKTGAKLNHAYCAAQLFLYSWALAEWDDSDDEVIWPKPLVLQLKKDGLYTLYDMSDMPGDIAESCFYLHTALSKKGKQI